MAQGLMKPLTFGYQTESCLAEPMIQDIKIKQACNKVQKWCPSSRWPQGLVQRTGLDMKGKAIQLHKGLKTQQALPETTANYTPNLPAKGRQTSHPRGSLWIILPRSKTLPESISSSTRLLKPQQKLSRSYYSHSEECGRTHCSYTSVVQDVHPWDGWRAL